MKNRSTDPTKLHLGCFDCPIEGWHNTDITPHIWIARIPLAAMALHKAGKMDSHRLLQHQRGIFRKVHYLDLSRRFPYPDAQFDFVFSCHVFEHIPRPILKQTLSEIRRVMKPGGVMRVVVPDLSWFVERYSPAKADDFVKGVFEMENGLEKNRHHWMYSENSLGSLLEGQGFVDLRTCKYREGRCPDLELLDNRPDHSIFMEAEKASPV